MIVIPEPYRMFVPKVFGQNGADWLDRLPVLLETAAQQWSITLDARPFALSYNYVIPGVLADGTEVVLKAGVPQSDELQCEIAMLARCDGRGMVKLLQAHAADGIFLLERVRPGRDVLSLHNDDQAARITAEVMRRMWRPASQVDEQTFPRVEKWARGMQRLRKTFDGGSGPFDEQLVSRAEGLFHDLLSSQDAPVLLHGDLHHWNVLKSNREGWLAIDPKGILGEPAYEVGAFLRNPNFDHADWHTLPKIQSRRIAIFTEILKIDPLRIAGWGFAQAILSAWWSYEDGGFFEEPMFAVARSLWQVMQDLKSV